MKKTFRVLTTISLTLCLTLGPVFAVKPCEMNDYIVLDNGVQAFSTFSWSVLGDNCCAPTSGSAFVSVDFYNASGFYLFSSQGYMNISEAQFVNGCDPGV